MSNPHPSTGFQDYPEKGNKNGRPPKEKSLTNAIKQKISIEEFAIMISDLIKGEVKCPDCGAAVPIPKDAATLRFVYDHIDGRAVQKQILSTESDEPFEIQITERKAE